MISLKSAIEQIIIVLSLSVFKMYYIYLDAIQIIDRQNGGSLIFVTNEAEAFLFAGNFVAHQIDVHYFAVLRKNTDHITFGQIVRQSTDENPCTILVLIVPRGFVAAR